ncbi:MAG: hypothetical protein IJP81_04705 [Bacteroidales bacterium]|nr:hypothetical protein [Bacteroidales bacterium]
MNTNHFGRIGLDFMEVRETIVKEWSEWGRQNNDKVIDLTPLLQVLKHCHIKEGFVIEAIPPEYDGMSLPYARHSRLKPLSPNRYPGIMKIEELPDLYLPIEDAFVVDECPEGVWEAFLLWELHRHLPCIQHGMYGTRDLIFDLDSYTDTVAIGEYIDEVTGEILENEIQNHVKKQEGKLGFHKIVGYQSEEDIRVALSLRDCRILLPTVNVNTNRVYVAGWTPWFGLHRETLKYKRMNNSYGFLSLDIEHLANYWWGIRI